MQRRSDLRKRLPKPSELEVKITDSILSADGSKKTENTLSYSERRKK